MLLNCNKYQSPKRCGGAVLSPLRAGLRPVQATLLYVNMFLYSNKLLLAPCPWAGGTAVGAGSVVGLRLGAGSHMAGSFSVRNTVESAEWSYRSVVSEEFAEGWM